MDSLDSIVGSLGQNNNWQKLLTGGLFGAGELSNILQGQKQGNYQNLLLSLINNPAKLAAMIAKIQQPLSHGLEQAVGNQVQGDLAQRGLSQAPGIFGATEAQALAPYYQQNQQAAQNALFSALGLPAGTFQPQQNLTPSLQLFLKQFGGGGGTSSTNSSGFQWPIQGDTNPDWGGGFSTDSSAGGS